jgi:hypothetical protein
MKAKQRNQKALLAQRPAQAYLLCRAQRGFHAASERYILPILRSQPSTKPERDPENVSAAAPFFT